MKKTLSIFLIAMSIFLLSACEMSGSDEIQGVTVRESGDVAVTFTIPEEMDVEEVLGCEVGEETAMNTSVITNTGMSNGGFCYWCEVSNGGILCRKGDVYRYCPTAEASRMTGVWSPPAWLLLTDIPTDDKILNPEDAEKIKENYDIQLNFE